MVGALVVNLYAYQVKRWGGQCDQADGAIRFAMVLGVAYFVLFSWFFIHAYILKRNKSGSKKAKLY